MSSVSSIMEIVEGQARDAMLERVQAEKDRKSRRSRALTQLVREYSLEDMAKLRSLPPPRAPLCGEPDRDILLTKVVTEEHKKTARRIKSLNLPRLDLISKSIGFVRRSKSALGISVPMDLVKPVATKKFVSFDTVTVREYPLIMDSHPCCHGGPSLALGWEYDELTPVEVVKVEEFRRYTRRRAGHARVLSSEWRTHYAQYKLAHSEAEIAAVVSDNYQMKALREKSIRALERKIQRLQNQEHHKRASKNKDTVQRKYAGTAA